MQIKQISPLLSVSGQIQVHELQQIAELGFRTVINNRPENETDDQPQAEELAIEAARLGLVFINQPVVSGNVTSENSAEFARQLQRAEGPVLAFCRSGMRCTTLWALNEARFRNTDEILSFALGLGYDLKGQTEKLNQITALQPSRIR